MIAAANKTARASTRKFLANHKRCLHSTCAAHKSAIGIVQATNMPLSNLMTFVAPHQQQQQQRQQSPRQQMAQPPRRNKQNNHRRDPLSVLAAAAAPQDDDEISIMESLLLQQQQRDGDDDQQPPPLEVDLVELKRLASLTPTPLRLGDMYQYAASTDPAQRLRNAQFLHRELPLRLAQRAYDLLSLPHGLSSSSGSNNNTMRQVALMYVHYVKQFQDFPVPQSAADEDLFTELLLGMILDRTSIPTTISRGLMEWLDDDRHAHLEEADHRHQEMEDALQRFFTARVGLRFLTEHHILSSPANSATISSGHQGCLRQMQTPCPLTTEDDDQVVLGDNTNNNNTTAPPIMEDRGCIQHDCNAVVECQKVAQEVTRQTVECYGICPTIEILERHSKNSQRFTYVPHHLHYMLAELLKNSCRASVERYMEQGGDQSPTAKISPVRVVMVKGKNEMTIKVSDQGGGIPRSTMARIFKFTHSTARQDYEKDTDFGTVEAGIQHMRGFGLPLARIYARYFGGELTLKSMEGYGLDAYLYLPRLGDACENLPPRVTSSPGEQVSLPSSKSAKQRQKKKAATME